MERVGRDPPVRYARPLPIGADDLLEWGENRVNTLTTGECFLYSHGYILGTNDPIVDYQNHNHHTKVHITNKLGCVQESKSCTN